ncbi:hypothetical protein UMM65_15380 [Aureibaculum sp. 2210JD6-5]|uniref:hypothetical protein n=1 Tax=Aureibaculum sp. 2210JD6-5 TaxID=3103957 RepID=UPI002AADFBFB|nr:hypothetical protein [Aureibaculum sp. 2210JD6-5]MDY7396631.1 hypothetical protein [Aureibaculum sp. 2210JD6-5]
MEKNERDYIDQYQEKGYTADYQVRNGNLIDLKTKRKFQPDDVFIVAEHRFEGMSNPSDMSILYVIETDNGSSKGTVLAGYGPASDGELAEFFKKVPKSQFSNKYNIDEFEKDN